MLVNFYWLRTYLVFVYISRALKLVFKRPVKTQLCGIKHQGSISPTFLLTAVRKMLMKLTPLVNFNKILRAALTSIFLYDLGYNYLKKNIDFTSGHLIVVRSEKA